VSLIKHVFPGTWSPFGRRADTTQRVVLIVSNGDKTSSKEKSSQQNSKIAAEKIEKLLAILGTCEANNNLSLSALKKELQENNEKHLGVFRDEKLLKLGLAKTQELYEIFKNYKIKDKNLIWNEELIAYFELENLLLNSLATNFSALHRRESRGAHYRSDFQNRDDKNFHAHSLVRMESELEFTKKAVRNSSEILELNLELQKRSY
jgi:succinate dehydrogenase/fumarate reductase flavoprotein subunit